jgi:hypothetical protein
MPFSNLYLNNINERDNDIPTTACSYPERMAIFFTAAE